MKVLMLGWEFPPYFAGGVGIVCYELVKSLAKYEEIELTYVMPYGPHNKTISQNGKIKNASMQKNLKIKIHNIPSTLYAYDSQETYQKRFEKILTTVTNPTKTLKELYGTNLIDEVYLYAERVANMFEEVEFDLIHAHDWTTIPAAVLLKELTGKPFILHVHITELDKTGGNGGHEKVFEIERLGFEKADKIIAISNFIKNRLIHNYGVDESKIEIIHNGGISDLLPSLEKYNCFTKNDKIVLFAGRMTLQKGPEYFIKAAKVVLEYEPDTKFIIAGSGDMLSQMIELSADLGIGKSVLFYGFYNREEAEKLFRVADVFVMPSVSEPFGIVPLEAIAKGTPTIISKQSGISEVLENTFKVDFWDTDEIAHKIITLLRYPHLHQHMRELANNEFKKFNWDIPTEKITTLYTNTLNNKKSNIIIN